jgi:hypothetical protein
MSVAAISWAFKQHQEPGPKLLLLALANYADEHGCCWPSKDQLAADCSSSERSIRNYFVALEGAGLVTIQARYTENGRQTSNIVRLNMEGAKFSEDAKSAPTGEGAESARVQTVAGGRVQTAAPLMNLQKEPSIVGDARATQQLAVAEWNALASELSLPIVQKLTEYRKRKLAARLHDSGGIDGWRKALAKIRGSPFLRGETANGWRADFDFLVQESSFVKVLEGKYDGSRNAGKPRRSGPAQDMRDAFEEIREELAGSSKVVGF